MSYFAFFLVFGFAGFLRGGRDFLLKGVIVIVNSTVSWKCSTPTSEPGQLTGTKPGWPEPGGWGGGADSLQLLQLHENGPE
jgi:hypothetical protein